MGDASHLMQSMRKALAAQNDDMHFASPVTGPGQYSLEKTQTPLITCALPSTRLMRRKMAVACRCEADERVLALPPAGYAVRQFRSNMRVGLPWQATGQLWRALTGSVSCARYRIH